MAFNRIDGTMPAKGFDWMNVKYPPKPVREFTQLRYGKALRESDQSPGNVRVFGTNGPCGWHDRPLQEGPGVILGRKGQGHLGVKWCDDPFWVIDTAYYADIDRDSVDLKWFYYITKYVGLDHLKAGEKPGLNRDVFGRQLFPFPERDEQREIARILSVLDEKIYLNRRTNTTLEELSRTLFKSWFVDFEPVSLKASNQIPSCLAFDTAATFPAEFVDSTIGPIPRGWEPSTIGEAVRVVGGSTPSTRQQRFWESGSIPWCTPRDLSRLDAPVVLDTERKITEVGLGEVSSGLLPAGTVLLSSRAPIGYLAIADVPLAINQGFIAMICDKDLPNVFVLRWLEENMPEIFSRSGGTTFAEISKRNFRPIPIVVPSTSVLEKFAALAEPWHQTIVRNLAEISQLETLRDALLPQLLSGAIQLVDAEGLVGELV